MRLIVIGTASQRQELREQIESAVPDVVGEFGSLAEASDAGIDADGYILAAVRTPGLDETLAVESLTPREIDRTDAVRRAVRRGLIAL
jgi:hypothetical protein